MPAHPSRAPQHVNECYEKIAGEDSLYHPPPLIISKIESTEALDNLAEIIMASDGIMVARGDLGVEVPLEEVVTWQKVCLLRTPKKMNASSRRNGSRQSITSTYVHRI